ncbi:MAG: peptidase S58 family protein [Tindallia sp. MSAO_Bac2]|nr:MAG: peptidase S58 family protein [Tindallia sp. MSAO_Bac2]
MREISMKIIDGFQIGHCEDVHAATGCTVVMFPEGAVTGVDVRGGAPGTRETDLLNPVNLVEKAHAVILAGGSAFGLDAAGGVMKYLEEKGFGFDVKVARVPIVSSAVLFDLPVGSADIRPDAEMGYNACINAKKVNLITGSVGAGAGATVGKLKGYDRAMKGGAGYCTIEVGELKVSALMVVNAMGDVVNPETGKIMAGLRSEDGKSCVGTEATMIKDGIQGKISFDGNTTIGVVMTNADLNKNQATKIASMAQDGLARVIRPSHTMVDGDTIFAMCSNEVEADINLVGLLGMQAVEKAIMNAIAHSEGLAGIPGYSDIVDGLL